MKKISAILLIILSAGYLTAQVSDSTKQKEKVQVKVQLENKLSNKPENENQFSQSDQSLITDKSKRKKDVFVDKDGDGINDNRVSGMSFSKIRKRYQNKQSGHGGSGNNMQGHQGG